MGSYQFGSGFWARKESKARGQIAKRHGDENSSGDSVIHQLASRTAAVGFSGRERNGSCTLYPESLDSFSILARITSTMTRQGADYRWTDMGNARELGQEREERGPTCLWAHGSLPRAE